MTGASGDSASIVLLAEFGKGNQTNFKIPGRVDGSNFHYEDAISASFFQVVAGKISGNSENNVQRLLFSGDLKRESAKLEVEVTYKEASDPFPAGFTHQLEFYTIRGWQFGEW